MDILSEFRRAVLGVFGLDEGWRGTIDRLALYPCRVEACASDGSTVDVRPVSPRVRPMSKVPVRVGIPGAVAVVQPGARVLLGWEGGDPSKPFAVPSWDSGATVQKLILKANMVYLGDESGAEPLVRKSDFDNHVHAAGTLLDSTAGAVTGATAGATPVTGTSLVRGK